jgi:hypothetical protein
MAVLKSIKDKVNINEVELEITDDLTVTVNQKLVNILEAIQIAQFAAEEAQEISNIQINENSTKQLNELINRYAQIEEKIYEGICLLVKDIQKYEELKTLGLSLENLIVVLTGLIAAAQNKSDDEEGERFRK